MKSEWNINLTGDIFKGLENVLTAASKIDTAYSQVEDALDAAFTSPLSAIEKFGSTVFKVRNAVQGIDDIANGLWSMVEPVVTFDKKARELQSITNVTEPVLDQIKGFAKESASAFGGDAANYLETYKVLLSKLGPELADKPDLLKQMGVNVATLSKSMEGDTTGAVNVLTTAMNQYGVSIDDPMAATEAMTDMMNKMQAGAIAGSSELPELQAGIAASGAMAKAAGVEFSELNAALQVLDKGSKKGAEGGVALRNALGRMSEGRFMPQKTQEALVSAGVNIDRLADRTLTFKERLSELSKIKSDGALVGQFFGMENVAAGQFMLDNIELLGEFTAKIEENKTAAIDSANIVMQSHEEKMSRMFAFFNNLKISLGEVLGGAVPYLHEFTSLTGGLLQTVPGIVALIDLWGMLAKSQKFMTFLTNIQTVAVVGLTVAQELLTMAFYESPWGWVALAIGAVVAGLVYAYNKFDWFRAMVWGVGESLYDLFAGLGKMVAGIFNPDLMMEGVAQLKSAIKGESYKKGVAASEEADKQKQAAEEGKPAPIAGGVPPMPEADLGLNLNNTINNKPTASADKGSSSDRSRFTNVTIHIAKLFDSININTTKINQSYAQVEDELLRVITNATNNLNNINFAGKG